MSTDLVYVSESIAPALTTALLTRLNKLKDSHRLVTPASKSRLTSLLADAEAKGATIHQPFHPSSDDTTFPLQ